MEAAWALLLGAVFLSVPFAGLAVWKIGRRTGHRKAAVLAAVLGGSGVFAPLAFFSSLLGWTQLSDLWATAMVLLLLAALGLAAVALWLAFAPWSGDADG